MNLFRAQDANILFNKKDKITFYSRDCIQFWLVSVSNWQSATHVQCYNVLVTQPILGF